MSALSQEARVLCPVCGTEHPPSAHFCMNCGAPFGTGGAGAQPAFPEQWEYREVTIPLNLTCPESSDSGWLRERYDQIVQAHLQYVQQEGWQPDNPTDWGSMWSAGRIESVANDFLRASGADEITYTYQSATVRLKRPVQ